MELIIGILGGVIVSILGALATYFVSRYRAPSIIRKKITIMFTDLGIMGKIPSDQLVKRCHEHKKEINDLFLEICSLIARYRLKDELVNVRRNMYDLTDAASNDKVDLAISSVEKLKKFLDIDVR